MVTNRLYEYHRPPKTLCMLLPRVTIRTFAVRNYMRPTPHVTYLQIRAAGNGKPKIEKDMTKGVRIRVATIMLAGCFLLPGCFTQQHIIGDGARTGQTEEVRQWYVLWGLVPINKIDTQELADGADNYEIKTEFSGLDILISIFTQLVTVYPMTVTVTR